MLTNLYYPSVLFVWHGQTVTIEPDQTLHCLLSALSKIVNYYPKTHESDMDPSFWQYCEIPVGLTTTTTTKTTTTTVTKRIYQSPTLYLNYLSRLQYNFARMHFCDFIFQIQFCVEFFNYQVNIFASCWTRIFAAALWSNLNAMIEKRLP